VATPPQPVEPTELAATAAPSDDTAPVAADPDAAALATARVVRRLPDEPTVDPALQVRESHP
jgi:hypothetical protein